MRYARHRPDMNWLSIRIICAYLMRYGVRGIADKANVHIMLEIRKSLLGAVVGRSNKKAYPKVLPKKFIPSQNPKIAYKIT